VANRRYNVLNVISDQHQAACMGCEGHTQALTPNMDRLAASGVRFDRAYTQNPICTPSRVSIFSGQYVHNHGYYGLSGPTPERLPGFLGHFKANGYRTAAIGKLHMPDDPVNWLADQTDYLADSYMTERRDQDPEDTPYFNYLRDLGIRENEDSIGLPEFEGKQQHEARPSLLPFEHSVEGWCASEALAFIDGTRGGDSSQPFCMQVSLPRPHQCYTPDQRFWDMYPDDLALPDTIHQDPSGRPPHFRDSMKYLRNMKWLIEPKTFEDGSRRVWRGYLAAITQVDHALGLLMDGLRERGLTDDTIVIYHADHGAYSGTFGVPEKAPGICSDAVCRIPMIWYVPGVTTTGDVVSELVENVDIAPTINSLCGVPEMDTVDGHDISGLLDGRGVSVRDGAVTENPWSKSIRWDRWRLVHYQPELFQNEDGESSDVGELYDMEADPWEARNLYTDPAHRKVVETGRRLLLEWLIRTTRVTTVWPVATWPEMSYDITGDGKESNNSGAEARRAKGHVHYL
jgi:arylsulfatase